MTFDKASFFRHANELCTDRFASSLNDKGWSKDRKIAMHGEEARYEGDDTTYTSPRELWAWYSYGSAAEVFSVCGVGQLLDPFSLCL